MKIRSLLLCGLPIVLLLATGCSKDETEEPTGPAPAGECRITTITQPSSQFSYSYNANGRMTRMASSTGSVEEYSYFGDTIRIVRTGSSGFESRKFIKVNAAGLALKVRTEFNQAGTIGNTLTHTYNGNELAQQISEPIGGGPTNVILYTWSGGNLTEIRTGSTITTLEYYLDKPVALGDYMGLVELTQGFKMYKNKNLVRSISSSSGPSNIAYNLDAADKITSLSISGLAASTIQLTYVCN